MQAKAVAKAYVRERVLGLATHGEVIIAKGKGAGVSGIVGRSAYEGGFSIIGYRAEHVKKKSEQKVMTVGGGGGGGAYHCPPSILPKLWRVERKTKLSV